MARRKYVNYAVDSAGNTIASAAVEVRDSAGVLATLYEASTGATEAYSGSNPFSADSSGFFEFFVESGLYTITVGSGASSTTYEIDLYSISDYGLTLVDDADAATARTTLGLAIGTDVQAYSTVLQNTTASYTTAEETKLAGIGDDGSAATPSYNFSSDTDTGFYRPGADNISASTGGVERLNISNTAVTTASGVSLGIGEPSPDEELHITGTTARAKVEATFPNGGTFLQFVNSTTGTALGNGFEVGYSIKGYMWNYENTDIDIAANNTVRVTIPAAGGIKTVPTTVASLPAAGTVGAGTRHFVTDANSTTFASVVAGGGANGVPVYSDGTDWRIG